RLVQDIRERNDPSLAKDWDISIQDQEETFKDDLRAASGVGKRRKGKTRASGPALSQQVRSLIGDGNQAFVDSDLPGAIRIMQEVIRIEPRAAPAWSVLAQCYEDIQQKDRALQLRIMAAHLIHDAEEWDRLAQENLGFHQQALYCYRKVYSLDPSNVDALWERAVLAKEIGDLRIASQSFLAILKRFPHDLTVLSEIRPILLELGELATGATLFQNAFDHYQQRFPAGSGPISGPPGSFSILNLLVLSDLYNTLEDFDKAIRVIKAGSRWLQGRGDQRYWDLLEDDREFDIEGINRAACNLGTFLYDVNARHRLAVARIRMGDANEGIMHANIVLQEDVLDYAALFGEIADAYYERGMWMEARPVYELLSTDESTSSVYILLQIASCYRMLDELKEAADIYEHVRLADPTNNDAKMKLAEIYEILNEPRKALDLVYQVIDSRKRRPKDPSQPNDNGSSAGNPSSSLFSEDRSSKNTKSSRANPSNPNRLSQAQLKELEAEKEKDVLRIYRRIKEIWGRDVEGEGGESKGVCSG
ncbi:TPR-like protein, partial [Gymnopus androsaceus JB14]